MSARGLGEIRTSSSLTDRRKIRSAHGAYLQLSSIALQRQRLSQEIKAADKRAKVLQGELRKLDQRAEILRRYLDTKDASVLDLLKDSPRGVTSGTRPHGSAVRAARETELHY